MRDQSAYMRLVVCWLQEMLARVKGLGGFQNPDTRVYVFNNYVYPRYGYVLDHTWVGEGYGKWDPHGYCPTGGHIKQVVP